MDSPRFDALTRSLATAKTRRGLLGSLAALGAGLLGAQAAGAQVTQAQCGNKICGSNPGVCTNGCVCCAYPNGNSRCRPPQDCTSPGAVATTTTTPAPCAGIVCGDGSCASLTDPTACGCARERCPVNEACVAGACVCAAMGSSAAPFTCCLPAPGGPSARCADGDDPGSNIVNYIVADTCAVVSASCPPGYVACDGDVGTPGTPDDSCRACCPQGTTCDLRGFCRQ